MIVCPLIRSVGLKAATASSRVAMLPMFRYVRHGFTFAAASVVHTVKSGSSRRWTGAFFAPTWPDGGLEEEEQALDSEREPQHGPVLAHQPRPQQAHLERQHRAGHRADCDQHPHHLGPAPRQPHRSLVGAPQRDELSQ